MQNIFVKRTLAFCLALALVVGFAPPLAPPMEAAHVPPGAWHFESARHLGKQRALESYLELPLYFIANRGQVDERVHYYTQGSGHAIYFTAEEVVVALDETLLRMRFVGANATQPVGLEKMRAKVNYLIGSDPAQWQTNVPTYGEVAYHDLYPGIDLRYAGQRGALKYTFVVSPGADASQIRLAYGGAAGLRLDEAGNLLILAARSELKDTRPYAYQEIGGRRVEVETEFVLYGVRTYGFAVQGGYDPRYPLIIDPSLIYSTYLGGSKDDRGYGIAVDGAGHAYVTGNTWSTNFPTRNAFQGACGVTQWSCLDTFVTKIDPTQSGAATLIYSTYLGGEYEDRSYDIAVDGAGHAYVTGNTRSEDFPITPNAYQTEIHDYDYPYPALGPSWNGSEHVFVTKLNAAGSELLYSTFLRGKNSWLLGDETGYSIAVYGADIAYVTGASRSSDFPTTPNAYQGTKAGDTTTHDVFFTKIDTTQSGAASLLYSTYLGGSETERGLGIAVDGVGNAYITGQTYSSPDFPTRNAYQGAPGGDWDAIVAKFDAAGALAYSTYLGGSGLDWGYGIAVDGAGHAYVTGETESNNFPTTPNAYQAANAGQADAFVVKIDATKSGAASLIYSTYLGGEGAECYYSGCAIAVDGTGHAYVTGSTESSYFPTRNPYRDDSLWDDAFVTKFNAAGNDLVYSTYLGGNGSDGGTDIALDGAGNAYVSGMTTSTEFFDTKNPYQATNAGQVDAFVVVLGPERSDLSTSSKQVSPTTIVPTGTVTHTLLYTITLVNTGSLTATTAYLTDTLPVSLTLTVTPACPGGGTCAYNAPNHTVTWTGSLTPSASVVVTYAGLVNVPIGTADTFYFVNTARVDDGTNAPTTLMARSAVNPQDSYLPIIRK